MDGDRQRRATSFGARAELYDATRPTYPDQLVRRLLAAGARDVLDVGAGTGKLTRLLAAAGASVTAVEPDAGMRSVLARTTPEAAVVDGSGESLPVADESADVVAFAQAWHWVDPVLAAREARRVLRPGGLLALIWNCRDESDSWVADVETLTDSGARASELLAGRVDVDGFVSLPVDRYDWSESLQRKDLLARAQTWSSVATLPAAEQDDVMRRLERLLDTAPETAGKDALSLPTVTLLFPYRRV